MKKNKPLFNKQLWIGLCILFSNSFFAQDYKPGYIITKSDDSINGFINLKIAEQHSYSCSFKKDSLSEMQKLYPYDLKEYTILPSLRYVNKRVQLDSTRTENLFLECIFDGTINLYLLYYMGSERFFIEKDNTLYELKNDDITYQEDGKSYRYKRVLNYLLQGVPQIQTAIQKTDLERKALSDLLVSYQKAINKTDYIVYHQLREKKIEKIKWHCRYGISMGLGFSGLSTNSTKDVKAYQLQTGAGNIPAFSVYNETNIPGIENTTYKGSASKNILPGIFINFTNNTRHSFQIEFLFLQKKFYGNDFKLTVSTLSLPVLYKREFLPNNRLRPFFDVGFCIYRDLGFKLDNFYYQIQEPSWQNNAIVYSTKRYYSTKENSSINKNHLGIVLGLGVKYGISKKHWLDFEARVDATGQRVTSDLNEYISIKSSFNYLMYGLMTRFSF